MVEDSQTPTVLMMPYDGVVGPWSHTTHTHDGVCQQHWSCIIDSHGNNSEQGDQPSEFHPLPVNLCSALIISCSKKPLPGLKMRLPLATKAPLEATTLSK